MQLEKMTARVRPRQSWEAMDLGIMLVQQWWGRIAWIWVLVTLPVFILINLLLHDHYIWAIIIFWWLLPVFDRIPLHIISRTLFGEFESSGTILKSIPSIIFPHIIKTLTFLRLDPGRSFNLPVWQLEKLRGSARAQRSRVLNKMTSGSAFSLMFMCIQIELIVFFSLVVLIFMFTPEAYTDELLAALNPAKIETHWWGGVSINFLAYLSFLVVEPFYVAAGFSLYINRRTQLEGWDIEIVFRQLSQRLQQSSRHVASWVVALLLVAGVSGFSTVPNVYAEQVAGTSKIGLDVPSETSRLSNTDANKAIDEIMARKEFSHKEQVTKWRYTGKKKESNKEDDEKDTDKESSDFKFKGLGFLGSGLGTVAEILLWLIVAVLVVLAVYYALRWVPTIRAGERKNREQLPKSLFGMEITPESLPEDVGAAAMELWRRQEPLQALSLLYRGALTTLVHHHGINLKGSATEGDCIRITHLHREKLTEACLDYFKQLTMTWQQAAYAHRLPNETEIQVLSEQWQPHFGVSA